MSEREPLYNPAEQYRPIDEVVKSPYLDNLEFSDSRRPSTAIYTLTDFLAKEYAGSLLGNRYEQLPFEQKELVDATVAERLVANEGLHYLITLLRIRNPQSWSSEQEEEVRESDILSQDLEGGLTRQFLLQRVDGWSDRVKRFALWKGAVSERGRLEASKAAQIFFSDSTPPHDSFKTDGFEVFYVKSQFLGEWHSPETTEWALQLTNERIAIYERLQAEVLEKEPTAK